MNSAPLTVEQEFERLKAEVQKLHDDCAPYLKDGEGIVDRLARYHDETQSLLGELAKEKIALEEAGRERDRMREALGRVMTYPAVRNVLEVEDNDAALAAISAEGK